MSERDPWEMPSPSQGDATRDPWEAPAGAASSPAASQADAGPMPDGPTWEHRRVGETPPGSLASGAVDFLTGATTMPARVVQSLANLSNQMPHAAVARAIAGPEAGQLPQAITDAARIPDSLAGRAGAAVADIGAAMAAGPSVAAQAAMGAALSPGHPLLGAGFGAGGSVLGRTLAGLRPTPAAQRLMDAGAELSPGQAIGGTVKRVEEWAGSNPVASLLVRPAQARGIATSQHAAAESIGQQVGQAIERGANPAETIASAREAVSRAYGAALDGVQADAPALYAQLAEKARTLPQQFPMLPADDFAKINSYLMDRIRGLWVNNGQQPLTGAMLKQIDSEIGQHVRNLAASTDMAAKTARPAWGAIQSELRDAIASAAGGEKAEALRAANNAFRQLLAMEKAIPAGKTYATPLQLARSVARMKAEGTPVGELSAAMRETLPANVPDSGTAERLIANAMMGGAGWATMGVPGAAAGLILGTSAGTRALTGQLPYQQALAQALRRVLTPAGAQLDDAD